MIMVAAEPSLLVLAGAKGAGSTPTGSASLLHCLR